MERNKHHTSSIIFLVSTLNLFWVLLCPQDHLLWCKGVCCDVCWWKISNAFFSKWVFCTSGFYRVGFYLTWLIYCYSPLQIINKLYYITQYNYNIWRNILRNNIAATPESHTGNVISMGKGALYARSMGQKLNTTSTTESETVGASDCLGQTIWTMNFLEHQGVKVRRNYYYQDNESAMRLEKNGIQSASKR